MKNLVNNKLILLLLRIVVGGIFILAAVTKIADPLSFARDVKNYRLVGQTLSFFTAITLPWIELVAGVFLIAGFFPRSSALVVSGLLVFFILLVTVTIIRGIDVTCGCFGTFSRKADLWLIFEDTVWLVMAMVLLLSPGNDFCLLKRSRKQ
ncbi:MAG: MauE/DoxX family redox-associated membrane protein [Candidatus Saccharicenans sp.]|nr:MauE/DoxX family redox-associated membrane protein [Candidatus Saccharicenans sp.]